ncbi:MAG: hypothetical protein H6544_08435 [Prevotellaceae bacterium]|nr:hypothetical protein [Prevotellaceae bacterium]
MKHGFAIGATLVLIGAAFHLFGLTLMGVPVSCLLILAGGLGIFLSRKFNEIPTDTRLKRLKFQNFISNILILLSSYLIYIEDKRWMVTLLLAAVIEMVVVFRTPDETK